MDIDILTETPDYIAVLKPSGMPVEPDLSGDLSLSDALSDTLRRQGKPAGLFTIHRLDRPVGGIVLFARNKPSAARLSEQFSSHNVRKIYLAVTASPLPEEGVLCDFVLKDARAGKAFVTDRMRSGVKKAELIAKRLEDARSTDGSSRFLYAVRLLTGRFHQIRVQFASRHAPLCGDGKYGSRDNHCSVALFAARLTFSDRGKEVTVCAPVPTGYPWSAFSARNGSDIPTVDEM